MTPRRLDDRVERVADLEREHRELEARLGDPELIADQPRYQEVARRYRELEPIVVSYRDLKHRTDDLAAAKEPSREADATRSLRPRPTSNASPRS